MPQENRYPTDLTDAQWKVIKPLVSDHGAMGRPLKHERRRIIARGVRDLRRRPGARELLRQVGFIFSRLQVIRADGGYAGQLLGWVRALRPWGKLHLEIVRRAETAAGFAVVRKRWIVERNFAWLYRRRRLVRDYERRTDHSEAFIYIAMIGLMTKRPAVAKL